LIRQQQLQITKNTQQKAHSQFLLLHRLLCVRVPKPMATLTIKREAAEAEAEAEGLKERQPAAEETEG
jgi:hypothetical protein